MEVEVLNHIELGIAKLNKVDFINDILHLVVVEVGNLNICIEIGISNWAYWFVDQYRNYNRNIMVYTTLTKYQRIISGVW